MKLLTVVAVRPLTPRMVRVTFAGEGLDSFETWPDQQLKLLFPKPGFSLPRLDFDDVMSWYQAYLAVPEAARPWMRSFTVRSYDPSTATIDVDFVLHGPSGPASRWAAAVSPGDVVGRYGPDRMYHKPLGSADWYLLAGDETAIPAIGSLLESLSAPVQVFVSVVDEYEKQDLGREVQWVPRGMLLSAVSSAIFPDGSVFAWLAGEAGEVRELRRHLVGERGLAKQSIDFTGYWRRSLTQDDAPTEEDLADIQDR
ncbi:siderophore-interacting protein [Lentzea sp. NBRC 105346]|uniref:siderophore-interacting protein n=1 Tax=Lentzea sp. NBRC 105346 TaxID=3032205 RepID=UPI0024A323AE|nr:siderophore-interacting protein [Lentzea sp. NBRC 105346]GLZ33735.1 siderophore-interacting protein [Lentzea sp. NBRC 105346]